MGRGIGVGMVVGVLALAAAGAVVWTMERQQGPPRGEKTISRDRIVAEGRVVSCPDAEVSLKSEYAGVLERYTAHEHDRVMKGDLLALIGADDVAARLDRARARLKLAEARFDFAEKQLRRAKRLQHAHAFSHESFDRAMQDFNMAQSGKEQEEATVRLYQFTLLKARIVAPIKGTIVARYHNQGEYVRIGSRIVTIADLDRTRIEAEVDEYDADRVRVSAPVVIRSEGSPRKWKGIVSSVSDRVSRKHLVPDDPSRPTDTGIVHVKIAPLVRLPFKLGEKVTVRIGTAPQTLLQPSANPNSVCGDVQK